MGEMSFSVLCAILVSLLNEECKCVGNIERFSQLTSGQVILCRNVGQARLYFVRLMGDLIEIQKILRIPDNVYEVNGFSCGIIFNQGSLCKHKRSTI